MKIIFILLLFSTVTTATEYETVVNLLLEKKDEWLIPHGFFPEIMKHNRKNPCNEDSQKTGREYLQSLKDDDTFLLLVDKEVNTTQQFEVYNGKQYRIFSKEITGIKNARCASLLKESCEDDPDYYWLIILKCWAAYIYDYKLDT